MLFERCHNKNRKRYMYLKQRIKYFNFRSKVQLDHPIGTQHVWRIEDNKMCLKSPGTDVGAAGFERVSQDF